MKWQQSWFEAYSLICLSNFLTKRSLTLLKPVYKGNKLAKANRPNSSVTDKVAAAAGTINSQSG